MKESSDLVDLIEDAEEERVKGGRGLLFVGCDAKYDAGLNDRLAMAMGMATRWDSASASRLLRNCEQQKMERTARAG
jgi:hypothetical protein